MYKRGIRLQNRRYKLRLHFIWKQNLVHFCLLPCRFHGFSQRNCPSQPIPMELSQSRSHDHSLLFPSYLCRIKRKKTSSCNPGGYQLQDLTHVLLDFLPLELLRRTSFGATSSIFDLWSKPCGGRLLDLRGISMFLHNGSGITTQGQGGQPSWKIIHLPHHPRRNLAISF